MKEVKIVNKISRFFFLAPEGLKRFDPNADDQDKSPKCGWPKLMNNEICDFTIQDKKNCDFDWNDCENSELCLEFKQTLNCSDVKILQIKNQSKIVQQKWTKLQSEQS